MRQVGVAVEGMLMIEVKPYTNESELICLQQAVPVMPVKLAWIKHVSKLNHVALRSKIYHLALQVAYQEIATPTSPEKGKLLR